MDGKSLRSDPAGSMGIRLILIAKAVGKPAQRVRTSQSPANGWIHTEISRPLGFG
jgi:hypothetical protein